MSLTHHLHQERHFTSGDTVRDVVLGMADGLTVPFALAAGLSGAIASSNIVVTAGVAEVVAGSIAMGLGGYLAARSEAEHYDSEYKREQREIREIPEAEVHEINEIFARYGLSQAQIKPLSDALRTQPDAWADFMMRFELGLEKPNPKRALWSALTIGGSYIVGGLIPLLPYFAIAEAGGALKFSAVITLSALLLFGFVKGRFTGEKPLKSAVQTALIGGLAATAAFVIARAIS